MKMFLSTTVEPEDRQSMAEIDDFQRHLKNCLSAIMVLGQNKQVIKKTDLNKAIYSGGRPAYFKTTKLIMAQASHDLLKYMGMRLYELSDNKGYLLVNAYTDLSKYRKAYSDEQCDELAVIFLTLMEIFSSAEEASSEEQIREVLQDLDLKETDFKRHFEMLLKKLYIVPVREATTQQEEKLYKWGPRAIAEVDPEKFMESFLDLAEEGEAKDWPDQQRRVEQLKAARNIR